MRSFSTSLASQKTDAFATTIANLGGGALGMKAPIDVGLGGHASIFRGDMGRVGGFTDSTRGLASADDGVRMIAGGADQVSNTPSLDMVACSTCDALA